MSYEAAGLPRFSFPVLSRRVMLTPLKIGVQTLVCGKASLALHLLNMAQQRLPYDFR